MFDITIIIPTYNSVQTLGRCLDSIARQSVSCSEIIIVDRFSKDGTTQIAKSKGARVVPASSYRSAARNIGVVRSSTSGVLFVDSDMILSPDVISDCVRLLEWHDALIVPEVSIGHGFWAECRALDKQLSIGNELSEAARCFRRDTFLSLGGYEEALEAGEDWDLTNRLKLQGFTIGRIQASVSHNEGTLRLALALRKKYGYGKTFGKYLRRNPTLAMRQVNPVSRILLPSIKAMRLDPIHGTGLLVLKSLEFVAAGVGQISIIDLPFGLLNRS